MSTEERGDIHEQAVGARRKRDGAVATGLVHSRAVDSGDGGERLVAGGGLKRDGERARARIDRRLLDDGMLAEGAREGVDIRLGHATGELNAHAAGDLVLDGVVHA